MNLTETFKDFKDGKNIDRPTMMRVLEDVFRTLIKKKYGSDDNFDVIVNTNTGDLELWRRRTIVPDGEVTDELTEISITEALELDSDYEVEDECNEKVDTEEFGRRAVMAARQTLVSRIMELEKDEIFKRYEDRIGDLITGEINQVLGKEVLVLDCSSNFDKLNPKEQKKINEFLNPLHWYKILNQNRNSFSKNKKIYYNLIGKVENNLKSQLEKIIFDKLELLKEGAISTPLQLCKKGAVSTIIYNRICTDTKTSICRVTGLDISMQRDNSILLSHTGLKYYHDTNNKIFEQIKKEYLSKVWYNSDFQTQIKEIAHNIRNTRSNQSIKQTRIYKPEQLNILSIF